MIPNIIHYCWFGKGDMPVEYEKYIQQWKQLHPGWTIKRWDESNSPLDVQYIKNALDLKNWANVSNYTRLYALRTEGGIYLDTDMNVLQSFEQLLTYNCFLGFEAGEQGSDEFWLNNAVMGAVPGHPFILTCEQYILENFDGAEKANMSSPHLVTKILKERYGLQQYGRQMVQDIMLFEKEAFYPVPYNKAYLLKENRQYDKNTIAVHMWGRTWFDHEMMLNIIDDLQRYYNDERNSAIQYAGQLNESNEQLQKALASLQLAEQKNQELNNSIAGSNNVVEGIAAINSKFDTLHEALLHTQAKVDLHQNELLAVSQKFDDKVQALEAALGKQFDETHQAIQNIQSACNESIAIAQQHMQQQMSSLLTTVEQQFAMLHQQGARHIQTIDDLTAVVKKQEGIINHYKTNYDQSSIWLIAKRRLLTKQKPNQ